MAEESLSTNRPGTWVKARTAKLLGLAANAITKATILGVLEDGSALQLIIACKTSPGRVLRGWRGGTWVLAPTLPSKSTNPEMPIQQGIDAAHQLSA